MHFLTDSILVVMLLLNFFVLGTSRLRAVIQGSAAQGVLLGLLALVAHQDLSLQSVVFAFVAIGLKAAVIPAMLMKAMREASIRREVEPLIGFLPSLWLGALATGLAVLFAGTLPLAAEHRSSLLVPCALATVLVGFIILTTRKKAITQVVGYLILENGIYIMGLTLVDAVPLMVEAGVLLDLLVGIFVLGIIINHINREFASLDTARLDRLKEPIDASQLSQLKE